MCLVLVDCRGLGLHLGVLGLVVSNGFLEPGPISCDRTRMIDSILLGEVELLVAVNQALLSKPHALLQLLILLLKPFFSGQNLPSISLDRVDLLLELVVLADLLAVLQLGIGMLLLFPLQIFLEHRLVALRILEYMIPELVEEAFCHQLVLNVGCLCL